jgi:hypothetical protein
MNRDSIHVTMTAPLRRAQVRQRLESLAARTGLPVAQLAGRALTIGLGQIEADLRLIFPAEPAPEQPTALEPAPEQPTALEPAPEPAQPTLSAAKSKPEATLRADRPDRVSSKAAARALNKTMTAFYARLHREPRLKRHSKLIGRAAMWDLAALRAEWAK